MVHSIIGPGIILTGAQLHSVHHVPFFTRAVEDQLPAIGGVEGIVVNLQADVSAATRFNHALAVVAGRVQFDRRIDRIIPDADAAVERSRAFEGGGAVERHRTGYRSSRQGQVRAKLIDPRRRLGRYFQLGSQGIQRTGRRLRVQQQCRGQVCEVTVPGRRRRHREGRAEHGGIRRGGLVRHRGSSRRAPGDNLCRGRSTLCSCAPGGRLFHANIIVVIRTDPRKRCAGCVAVCPE